MDYIDRLTNLRIDRDIKQTEVAQVLGIKQSAYSKYEKRRVKLQIEDLLKLCAFYNISADYILGLTDTPRPLK
ncbi:MAG: helix-turn-helix domain-containing protein [Candidatus Fimenecus sp.]